MNLLILFVAINCLIACTVGLPVTKKESKDPKEKEHDKEHEEEAGDLESVLEYERYLKEVVEALESDKEFRKKLDKAPEADIRTGKIAQELEYVNHQVRSKLDEIKRREIERLRTLANKQYDLSYGIDREHLKVGEHINHDNEHTFEIEDLKKLILKTSHDLAVADQKRREEFKQYEMQKEFEHQQKLKELDEEARKKFEEDLKQQKEKHSKHEKVHHPGNKAQLEEVWEKQDHMEGQAFDPRTFFTIHDVDGNGFWDETELKALFVKELDKVYKKGVPEEDLKERAEEMERMREHVFREADTNKDGLISYQELIEHTKREEFKQDPGWETVDEVPQYTHEEYLEFERRRQEEIQRLIARGEIPAHPNMPQGYYPDGHVPPHVQMNPPPQMHYQQQSQHHQQQQQYHQQQQQYMQQQQQQQYHQQQQQQQQYHQQQQQQYQQQQYNQQPPQQQYNPPPPQQQHNQPPPQQQQQYQPPPQQQNQPPQQQQQNPPPSQQQQQYQPPPPQNQQYQQQNNPQYQQQQQYNQQPPQQQQQQYQQPPPQQQQNSQQPNHQPVQLNSNQVYEQVSNVQQNKHDDGHQPSKTIESGANAPNAVPVDPKHADGKKL